METFGLAAGAAAFLALGVTTKATAKTWGAFAVMAGLKLAAIGAGAGCAALLVERLLAAAAGSAP